MTEGDGGTEGRRDGGESGKDGERASEREAEAEAETGTGTETETATDPPSRDPAAQPLRPRDSPRRRRLRRGLPAHPPDSSLQTLPTLPQTLPHAFRILCGPGRIGTQPSNCASVRASVSHRLSFMGSASCVLYMSSASFYMSSASCAGRAGSARSPQTRQASPAPLDAARP